MEKNHKKHPADLQDLWVNILWTDGTNAELQGKFDSYYICHKTNTAFHKNNIIPWSDMV